MDIWLYYAALSRCLALFLVIFLNISTYFGFLSLKLVAKLR